MNNVVTKSFGRNTVTFTSNNMVQIDLGVAVITMTAAKWDRCLEVVSEEFDGLTEGQLVERAALVAEGQPGVFTVRCG